jgi:hypothetical protein
VVSVPALKASDPTADTLAAAPAGIAPTDPKAQLNRRTIADPNVIADAEVRPRNGH